MTDPDRLAGAARRNVVVLALGMAALYGMVELVFGAAALTFEETGGSTSLAGLAPALFLACSALAAFPAGRAMDRMGRRPVLAAGFAAGIVGCLLAGLGVSMDSLPPALVGFALTGVATGIVLLSRAAAADMFPPERRPRAIGQVLFGAVFGALLGPLVFGPLLGEGDASALDLAWLGGAGFMVAGAIVISRLDPDPREISAALVQGAPMPANPSRDDARARPFSVREAMTAPGLPAAMLAVLASWAGMLTAMSLVSSALIDHGHDHDAVFPVLAAHFVGMFAFFGVVGRVIERTGRSRAIAGGLSLMAIGGAAVGATIDTIHLAALMLFVVGIGWNLSFVAATAELTERVRPDSRATMVGFADLLGAMTGAILVVVGGFALDAVGVVAIGVGAAALPALAAMWIIRAPAPAAQPAS